jgi:hypothetical protein
MHNKVYYCIPPSWQSSSTSNSLLPLTGILLRLVGGLILDKNEEDLIHSDIVPHSSNIDFTWVSIAIPVSSVALACNKQVCSLQAT